MKQQTVELNISVQSSHRMFKMSTTGQNTCVWMFAKVVDSFVDRYLQRVIPDLLQCTFQL